jgi:hypothetical protein
MLAARKYGYCMPLMLYEVHYKRIIYPGKKLPPQQDKGGDSDSVLSEFRKL